MRTASYLFLCFVPFSAAFIFDGEDHDETLQHAIDVIRQLSARVSRLSDKVEALQTKQLQNSKTLTNVQTDISDVNSRVSRDYIWFDDDWILAFRATRGIGQPVYDAWTHVGHHDDDPMTRDALPCGCSTINGSLPCDRHYRSRLLDTWPSASIDQVRLVLYNNGEEKQHITFAGTGTDYLSWFSQDRIVESSWSDLKTATEVNYFSISGDSSLKRRFFINHSYRGCPKDAGWMVAVDDAHVACDWEKAQQIPAFLYSPSNHDLQWSDQGRQEADVLAVFVKLRSPKQQGEVCN